MGGYLGRALASVVNLLNPDTIVLGGAVGEPAAPFVTGALQRELRAWALPVPVAAARVVPGPWVRTWPRSGRRRWRWNAPRTSTSGERVARPASARR
jgi:predicted NBD/HSP70 family sugar kinase